MFGRREAASELAAVLAEIPRENEEIGPSAHDHGNCELCDWLENKLVAVTLQLKAKTLRLEKVLAETPQEDKHEPACGRFVVPTIKMFPGDRVYATSADCTCGVAEIPPPQERKTVEFGAGEWASENDGGWGVYRSHALEGGGRAGGIVRHCGSEEEATQTAAILQAEWDAKALADPGRHTQEEK